MKKKITFCCLLLLTVITANLFTQKTFAQATFTTKTDIAITASAGAMFMIAADLNNDGKQDLITANQNLNGISILLNTTVINSSTPSFSAQVDFATGTAPHSVSAGDVNGDGLLDLVAVNTTSATASVFLNTTTPGAATPTLSAKTDFATGTNPYSVVLKDMNGDGKLDMVCANQLAATIGVFINTTTTGASTPTFTAMTAFTTPAGPTHLAVADFNGDGLPDVAVPNSTAASVSVFFNTTTIGSSTPTFGTRADFAAGSTVWSVSTGDFNLDGKPDIVCANRGAASVSYFLNTTTTGASTPSFSAATNLTVGSTPFGVLVADINNDGKCDILNGARGAAQFSVYMNTTTPGASSLTFLTKTDYTTASQPYFPVVADFNGDGLQDVAVNTGTGNSISVFINTTILGAAPSPSFGGKTDFTTGTDPAFTKAADFNGDGKPDLITTNSNGGTTSVFLNTTTPGASTPTFTPRTNFATSAGNPTGVCNADFNGDGLIDFAICSYSTSQLVSVYLNTTVPGSSTPTFPNRTDLVPDVDAHEICAADFNGDGKIDLACTAANFGAGTNISVFLNTTTPGATTAVFSARTDFAVGVNPRGITLGDFNKDGKMDIACVNFNSNSISVLLNTTTPGAATPSFTITSGIVTGAGPFALASGDFNGDGKTDLCCSNQTPSTVSVFLNTTTPGAVTPVFSTKTDFVTGTTPFSVNAADFNGDGKNDIICSNLGSNSVSVLLNTTAAGASTPSFSAKTDYTSGTNPIGICNADFNLDGKPDFACTNNTGASLSVFLNTATFPTPVELASFTSNVNNNNVTLSWSTVSEENNSGFDIERNSLSTGWNKVGFVQGNGTTNNPQSYSYSDNSLNSGRYSYRLKQIDYNGNYKYYDLQNEVVIGVPAKFALSQNYPNPFNPTTNISYELAIDGFVSLKIFDISGREVKQLVNEVRAAGYFSVQFDAKSLSSGTYFYKLTAGNFSDVKKMVVVK